MIPQPLPDEPTKRLRRRFAAANADQDLFHERVFNGSDVKGSA